MYIRKLGSVRNFNGQHGERFHIQSVKINGDLTQRRNSSFTYQVACRDGETNVIEMAYRFISHLCPPFKHHTYEKSCAGLDDGSATSFTRPQISTRGGYTLTCPPARGRMYEIGYSHCWKSRERVVLGIGLNAHLLQVISKWALSQEYEGTYECTGYTEITVPSSSGNAIYRANEYFHGKEWYDWALVRDPKNDKATYLGKILGFFCYNTHGFPMPYLVEKLGFTSEHPTRQGAR